MDGYSMDEKVARVTARLEAEKHGEGGERWNVPRTTAEFLAMMVRACGARKVLEIGTSNGYSGLFMAEALSHGGGLLYTVESNRARYEEAARNFTEAGLSSVVRQVLGHAPEVLRESGGIPRAGTLAEERDFDFVFMDATKNEYLSHLEAVLPKLRKGGLIVADNCVSHRAELDGFFRFVEGRDDLKSVLLPFDSGLMVMITNRN